MPWQWYDSKVVEIKDMSPTVKQFFLEVEGVEDFEFKAGQFITLDLPISEKRLKRWRSYSIANHPNGTNILELCIVYLDGGLGTDYLFNDIKVGSGIRFKGPSGAFYLPEEVSQDLVMICTGTGVAPFRSMLFDLIEKKKEHQKIHLIFGARTEVDILYKAEFEKIAREMEWFTYDICLSRAPNWEGCKGYVHQVYLERDYPENTKYFLCGWSQMIDEAVENLLIKKKIDRKEIIYELYG
jgi:CDP-4-dehydro-6-deoxyglucose reductase